MNWTAIGLFLLAAVALLGSPGPGIAALLAVTRGGGLRAGLRYYAGLQVGLALAAAVSAAGLFSLLAAFPVLLKAASIAAVLYLVFLAWKIGTAPVASTGQSQPRASPFGGFMLGTTNPKAYLSEGLSRLRLADGLGHADACRRFRRCGAEMAADRRRDPWWWTSPGCWSAQLCIAPLCRRAPSAS